MQLEDHRVLQFGAGAKAGLKLKSDAIEQCNSREVLAVASDSIQEVMKRMNSSRLEIILVVDPQGVLLGTVTDGDIRRGILSGIDVEQPVSLIMNPKPVTVCVGTSESEMLGLMRKRSIRHLPVVDGRRHLVGLERLEVLFDKMSGHNAVVMAGGLGSRLKPLTDTVPKPLIPVCGRPILDHILTRLHSEGVDGVVLSLNHLGDQIKEHVGDGKKHGVQVDYLTEKKRLGTAGALSLLEPRPNKPFIVMNGDLLTDLSFSKLLQFQSDHDYAMVICVRRHNHQVPYGVVEIRDGEVTGIREKPIYPHFINAGIYVMSPDCLGFIPKGEYCDMPDLIRTLVEHGKRVGVFPIIEYWRDLGTHADLAAAEQESRVVELSAGVWEKARPVEVQR
jgi:dTDP-glucose pyrophosphorylase/predicted transcriptional regulator